MTTTDAAIYLAPLRSSDILAYADLGTPDERGAHRHGFLRETGVHCGRPLVYPIQPAELPPFLRTRAESTGCRYHGAVFAFDLDALPSGIRYSRARFEVAFGDERALAVQVHADGDALGLLYGGGAPTPFSLTASRVVRAVRARPGWLARLAPRGGQARAWVSGVQSNAFRWTYDDPRGDTLVPRHYAMHALVEVPPDLSALDGTLGVQVELSASSPTPPAGMREAVPFVIPLAPGGPRPPAEPALVRLCLSADVEGYSRRPNDIAEATQRRLVDVLARARRHAGLDEDGVHRQPQGDAEFAILPAGLDESVVIPRLVQGLAGALRDVNRDLNSLARIRLRVALHRGLMKPGASGWVGSAPIAVHRILDSPPLRAALRDNPASDFVLGVPDVLFQDVIAHSYAGLPADDFTPMTVDLPDKSFVEHAWLYVPAIAPRA
ncbi:hypothetical protein [Phytohabitans rumicis]|uniref:Uncharacterized protein n=1 Tax=Phytohabitans rumicis TaxID=1076125 RepID=A0A6V8KWA4_9ACTN|nr:hypothetical protein [Phytohabitans rumicis]GFJ86589.1 hypothetical protein Prum_002310 [Phytohabitans rumicis]